VYSPIAGLNVLYDSKGFPKVGLTTTNNPNPTYTDNSGAAQVNQARTTIFKKNVNGTYGTRRMWRELSK
jgi:hypothetical protein